jgi:hypothetical protein
MGCVWPRLHLFPTKPALGVAPLLLAGGRNCAANRSGLSVWLNADGMASARHPTSQASPPWTEFSVSYQHNLMWKGDKAYRFDEGINASDLFETQA